MLQTKYITIDELRQYEPDLDLEEEFKSKEKALAFIYRVEVRLATWLDVNYFQKIDQIYPEFSDYQKKHYKLALMEQCIYVFRNGDISVDSGYDPGEGEKSNINTLRNIKIAPNAEENLIVCGLLNREIYKRYGFGGGRWPL